MKIIFWSEFPEKIKWEKIKDLNFKTEVYVAAKEEKIFQRYKKHERKNLKIYPWPVLEKTRGYWFSGFLEKKDIDKLKQFKSKKIKIDLEPPIYFYKSHYGFMQTIIYFLRSYFRKSKNNKYLKKTILELSKEKKIICSGFPFPRFYLKHYGDDIPLNNNNNNNLYKNYMFYSTFYPWILKGLMRIYLYFFAKKQDFKKTYFAIGLIGPGILKKEPVYKNIKQFEKDLAFLKKVGATQIVVYSLESLLSKQDYIKWIKILDDFCKK